MLVELELQVFAQVQGDTHSQRARMKRQGADTVNIKL